MNDKLKVIHIITALGIGGAERMLQRLVISSNETGRFQHIVISLKDEGSIKKQLESKGVRVIALGLNSPFHLPVVFIHLLRLLKSERPDIVQTWLYHADLIGGLAARMVGIKRVVWNIRISCEIEGSIYSFMTALIIRLCAKLSGLIPLKIISVAHRAVGLHKKYGYQENKFVVIGNGYDMERFSSNSSVRRKMREVLDYDEDHIVIGSVGRFNVIKDHRTFILAAEKDIQGQSKGAFLMLGTDITPENKILSEWINETGVSERFYLYGVTDEVQDVQNAMDIFCLHSICEGFPNVLGEAMSMGLPCVAADAGDAAHMLEGSGIVVPCGNPAVLAEALLQVIEMSPTQRQQLGDSGRKRIEEKYTMSDIVAQYESLYREIACE